MEGDSAQHSLLSKKLDEVTSSSYTVLSLAQSMLAVQATEDNPTTEFLHQHRCAIQQVVAAVNRLKQSVSIVRSFQSSPYERNLLSHFLETYAAFQKAVAKKTVPNSEDSIEQNRKRPRSHKQTSDEVTRRSPSAAYSSNAASSDDEPLITTSDEDNDDNHLHKRAATLPVQEAGEARSSSALSSFQGSIFQPDQIAITWKDIQGASSAVEALQQALILPQRMPHLFEKSGRRPWKCILLYGPPGTGKTMLASAAAKESNATLLSVSAADLLSKWVGDSEKTVRDLFQVAKQFPKCLIFLDEIDAMCGARGNEQESESSRRLKTEFLVRMQALHNSLDSKSITILAATNLPWELDAAFRRRFDRFIFMGLPDAAARRSLISAKLHCVPHALSQSEIAQFADITNMLSPSDIDHIVQHAVMLPVAELCQATHFRHETIAIKSEDTDEAKSAVTRDVFFPCDSLHPKALTCALHDLPPECVEPSPVTLEHLTKALSTHVASVTKTSLKQFADWEKSVNSFS